MSEHTCLNCKFADITFIQYGYDELPTEIIKCAKRDVFVEIAEAIDENPCEFFEKEG